MRESSEIDSLQNSPFVQLSPGVGTQGGSMITTSIRPSFRSLRSFVRACALLAFAALPACGTNLTPTVVDVSGHAVEVVEAGAGDATVVFESGLQNDWTYWDEVASEVAKDARVFAYSRPGYGDSDPTTEPRDASHIVENLRTLLTVRGFAPPYVLVGHSFGGTYMELFAKAHPEEVTGLVLVDTRHRDMTTACNDAGLEGCVIPADAIASLPKVERDEANAFASISDEIQAAGTFGSYPVRVLTATEHGGYEPKAETLWISLHRSLADEAADGDQTIFEGAGHNLQTEKPEEVAQVIRNIISAQKQ